MKKQKSGNQTYPDNDRIDSLYTFITDKFVVKPLAQFVTGKGGWIPSVITVTSFVLILAASATLLLLEQGKVINRVVVAVLMESSFALGLSSRQIAHAQGTGSLLLGAWLDTYLKRAGEMILYTTIGYVTWRYRGSFTYFIMGSCTGFLFTYHTVIYALKDAVFFDEIKNLNLEIENLAEVKRTVSNVDLRTAPGKSTGEAKRPSRHGALLCAPLRLLSRFSIGSGERYLYPILFGLIHRYDIMLPLVSVLMVVKAVFETYVLSQHIKGNEAALGA